MMATMLMSKRQAPRTHPTMRRPAASLVVQPRERPCVCGGTCSAGRAQHSADDAQHVWTKPIPPAVDEALAIPGDPLDAETRTHMESRFGHDFGKVRVHHDTGAAASALAVEALAYTVGHDIVMGCGQFSPSTATGRRLLAHELAHVVQYSTGEVASAGDPVLQRAGFGDVKTAEAAQNGEVQPPVDLAAGLPMPDCRTRFAEMFWIDAIYHPQTPECCFAQISLRDDPNRQGIFRADHLIEGRPDCDYGDQQHHDFWIGPWRILDITPTLMTVMNMWGEEETLDLQGFGSVRGEAVTTRSQRASAVPKPADPLPEHIVENSQGLLGKVYNIRYDTQCDAVHFLPIAPDKPSISYRWDPVQQEYVDNRDPTNTKTPGQLEQLTGIILKEYQDGGWQGKNCGDLPPWAL